MISESTIITEPKTALIINIGNFKNYEAYREQETLRLVAQYCPSITEKEADLLTKRLTVKSILDTRQQHKIPDSFYAKGKVK